jgi:bifunctional non-homologous end joining protein LigD
MAECRWLKPVLVGHFEFLEWTADDHLRHPRFVALRDDKPARKVKRE